jgi:hypothetical protein
MYCPLCRTEYREGFTRCADCDVDLVAALPSEAAPADESAVCAWNGDDPGRFSVVLAALQAAEIPSYQISKHDQFYWLPALRPEYEIFVRARDASRAREVIREALQGTSPE